jgi:hypothetical protein
MALLFCDSFDHYSSAQAGRKWTEIHSSIVINTTNGRRSTGSLRNDNSTTRYARKTLGTNAATLIVGFAIKITGGITTAGYIFAMGDAGADQMTLLINTDATISVRRSTTNVATSAAALNVSGAYQYLEFKVVHSATGSYEVRLNGSNILSASGVDTTSTTNNYANQISFFHRATNALTGFGAGTSVDIDDVYVCDGTGSANNDFLGDVRVDAFLPNGNGNSSQLVGSDGNSTDNYLLVDESPATDNTDYVESSTVSNKDTYSFANMAHTPATINGVQINLQAVKTDAGFRSMQPVIRSGGSDTDGAARALGTSYLILSEIAETDPNTAAAWTQSGFDNAEFGAKVAA